jgi:hypothetical protein
LVTFSVSSSRKGRSSFCASFSANASACVRGICSQGKSKLESGDTVPEEREETTAEDAKQSTAICLNNAENVTNPQNDKEKTAQKGRGSNPANKSVTQNGGFWREDKAVICLQSLGGVLGQL